MIIFVGMKKILTILLGMALLWPCAAAEKEFFGRVRLDRTVHDFGRITEEDGAQQCSFTLTNIGNTPLLIEAVVSSCGCTRVQWTRTTIAPGASGKVEASYSNDEGPYPFDKTLTVYVDEAPKPIVLHLRGEVVSKK